MSARVATTHSSIVIMAVALFISESYIKENSIIDENVDVKLIRSVIKEAQDIHIHPLIGTGLYNELETQINTGSVTADNTTLINNYIRKALMYWVIVEGLDVFLYRVDNKSLSKRSSDNAQPVGEGELIRMIGRMQVKAEWYSERVSRFLCENSLTYPLYTNPGQGSDIIHPNGSNYDDVGIWLGKGSPRFRRVDNDDPTLY